MCNPFLVKYTLSFLTPKNVTKTINFSIGKTLIQTQTQIRKAVFPVHACIYTFMHTAFSFWITKWLNNITAFFFTPQFVVNNRNLLIGLKTACCRVLISIYFKKMITWIFSVKAALAWKIITLIKKAQESFIPLNICLVKLCNSFYIYKQKEGTLFCFFR